MAFFFLLLLYAVIPALADYLERVNNDGELTNIKRHKDGLDIQFNTLSSYETLVAIDSFWVDWYNDEGSYYDEYTIIIVHIYGDYDGYGGYEEYDPCDDIKEGLWPSSPIYVTDVRGWTGSLEVPVSESISVGPGATTTVDFVFYSMDRSLLSTCTSRIPSMQR